MRKWFLFASEPIGPMYMDDLCMEHPELWESIHAKEATVARIWKALGISTYEQAMGKEISEIVAERQAAIEAQREEIERLKEANAKHLEALGYAEYSLKDTSFHGIDYARSTALRYISAYLASAALKAAKK